MRIADALCILAAGTALVAVAPAHAFEIKTESAAAPAAKSAARVVPVPLPPADIPNVPSKSVAAGTAGDLSTDATASGIAPTALAPEPGLGAANSAFQAFRTGTQAYLAGEKQKAVKDLGYAADHGHALATWKLGRMYAEGDGVKKNDLKAFRYFSKLASDNADISPYSPQARFISNAFVAVGAYYQSGIPNSDVKPDIDRARDMYSYAASYFGDPDAQYRLARLYLEAKGDLKDPRQCARWLSLAANKGHHQAQALLGHMLFTGQAGLPHLPARGLAWLTLAREGATGAEDGWIVEYYDQAYAHANEQERGLAHTYAEQWAAAQR
jgi:TPR repeat protein